MQRATWSQTKEPRRVSKPDYLGLVVKEGFLEEGTWLMNGYQSGEGVVWMHLPCRGRACIGRFWDSDRLGRGPWACHEAVFVESAHYSNLDYVFIWGSLGGG